MDQLRKLAFSTPVNKYFIHVNNFLIIVQKYYKAKRVLKNSRPTLKSEVFEKEKISNVISALQFQEPLAKALSGQPYCDIGGRCTRA